MRATENIAENQHILSKFSIHFNFRQDESARRLLLIATNSGDIGIFWVASQTDSNRTWYMFSVVILSLLFTKLVLLEFECNSDFYSQSMRFPQRRDRFQFAYELHLPIQVRCSKYYSEHFWISVSDWELCIREQFWVNGVA